MFYLAENLKKYRAEKGLTQEEVAEALGVTPQSVSRWERGECCPDVLFLPALANLFETSVDMLIGMDTIRAESAYHAIHQRASEKQREGDHRAAQIYREALLIYPSRSDMMLGLAGALALDGKAEMAIEWTEKGLACSSNVKQNATMRAALCFLYLQAGQTDRAYYLAAQLPHVRESREEILPLISEARTEEELKGDIRRILLGEDA